MEKQGNYEDIIHLSRPVSAKRAKMSNYDRAAQFSPFAALTGFGDVIEESGRLTQTRIELDEGGKQLLDEQMEKIRQMLPSQPRVTVVWFCYDERKAGGAYIRTTGNVKKIDTYCGTLLLTDGQTIPLGEIIQVRLEKQEI